MRSATVERNVGAQRPRYAHTPEYVGTTGPEAVELAAIAGLVLDDWQQYVLTHALGERRDGKWAAREVGLMVSRQNGKGALLEARELAGLFLLEENYIIHSAHQFDTASEHFSRLCRRIEETPELDGRVDKILKGHGNESITLLPKNGRRPKIAIRTRTGSGGLGFSIDCLVLDEAMIISEAMHQALIPTLSAQPNVQVWYTGSAVDEDNPSHDGVPFARIREKGLAKSSSTAYFEWSLDLDSPDKLGEITSEDLRLTNPGLGIRISEEYIREAELDSLSKRGVAVQRLGVGAWPRTDGLDDVVITPEQWGRCLDAGSKITGPVCFSVDVDPIRAHSSVCAAGVNPDGLTHVETVKVARGTGWVVDEVCRLVEKHQPFAVVLDGMSGAFALLPDLTDELKARGLMAVLREQEVTVMGSREHGQACGLFYDAVEQRTLRHLGEPEIADALRGAVKRDMSDAWAWSRKNSSVNITPLVGCTLALWAVQTIQVGTPRVWV